MISSVCGNSSKRSVPDTKLVEIVVFNQLGLVATDDLGNEKKESCSRCLTSFCPFFAISFGFCSAANAKGLERRDAEPISVLGVDEKAFRKGHSYFTIVNDLTRSRVLHVAENRKQSSLDGFWETLTEAQRESIQAVAMDMWDPYVASVKTHLEEGEGKIVYDKFHIAKHLGEAVDQVRRQENRTLRAAGDDRLAGTRYDWLRNPARMSQRIGKRSTNCETAD